MILPVPQAKRLKLTGEVELRDTAGGGASSPQLELGKEDRLKAQLLWSRCINTHGSPGANIPCDLHMEHLNKRLKTIRNMRGNVNPTTIHKAGKSITPVQRICEIFEAQTAKKHSNFHHMPEFGKDFEDILEVLEEERVFTPISTTRAHSSFDLKCGLLEKYSLATKAKVAS